MSAIGVGCVEGVRDRIPHLRIQALLALWCGEFEQTHRYLQEAGQLVEEIGLLGELWCIEMARGDLYKVQGDRGQARIAFEHASKIMYAQAERIEDGLVRAKFLATQQVEPAVTQITR